MRNTQKIRRVARALAGWVLALAGMVPTPLWACPFCNVDGPATRAFILTVTGTAILGGVFVLLWSVGAGHYRNVEAPKYRILEIDAETSVDLGNEKGVDHG